MEGKSNSKKGIMININNVSYFKLRISARLLRNFVSFFHVFCVFAPEDSLMHGLKFHLPERIPSHIRFSFLSVVLTL